jgi:hypothetical protein
MYDWRRFSGGMLLQAVETHPQILFDNLGKPMIAAGVGGGSSAGSVNNTSA